MRILSYIFLMMIIILGVTFATLNSGSVTINYYIGTRVMALPLLLFSVFAAGCILGMVVTAWLLIKANVKNHHLRKRLQLAEKEVENLRAIPLRDNH